MSRGQAFALAFSLAAWGGLAAAVVAIGRGHRDPLRHRAAPALRLAAVVAFALTWSFMLAMLAGDVARFPSFAAWFAGSDLWFEAYRRVTRPGPAWSLAAPLITAAPAIVLVFRREAAVRGFSAWPYAFVGMCVAIALAVPLFVLRALRTPADRRTPDTGLDLGLAIGATTATAAALALPLAEGAAFRGALVVLHAALVAPLVWPLGRRLTAAAERRLLWALALAVAVHHLLFVVAAAPTRATAFATAFADPAVASIALDALLCLALGVTLAQGRRGARAGVAFAVQAVVLSPALALAAAFAPSRERPAP